MCIGSSVDFLPVAHAIATNQNLLKIQIRLVLSRDALGGIEEVIEILARNESITQGFVSASRSMNLLTKEMLQRNSILQKNQRFKRVKVAPL